MTAKHTPGPWKVQWYPRSQTAEIETVAQELGTYRHMTNALPMCAGVNSEVELIPWEIEGEETRYVRYSAEACANARLMAAAPEMLEALDSVFRMLLGPEPKTLKGYAQRCSFIDRTVRNALNKAEGSSL